MDYDPATQRMIAELRKFQNYCEEQIQAIMTRLDEESKQRLSDYKEAEELTRRAAQLNNRWKRLTSLTVEGLVELDREILHEETESAHMKHSLAEDAPQLQELEDEIKSMENLANFLQYFLASGGDPSDLEMKIQQLDAVHHNTQLL